MRFLQFSFIRDWEDLGMRWKVGDVISLSEKAVREAKERMNRYPDADLCRYGLYNIPLSFLKPLKKHTKVGE